MLQLADFQVPCLNFQAKFRPCLNFPGNFHRLIHLVLIWVPVSQRLKGIFFHYLGPAKAIREKGTHTDADQYMHPRANTCLQGLSHFLMSKPYPLSKLLLRVSIDSTAEHSVLMHWCCYEYYCLYAMRILLSAKHSLEVIHIPAPIQKRRVLCSACDRTVLFFVY